MIEGRIPDRDTKHLEHMVVTLFDVVTQKLPKWCFRSPHVRQYSAFDDDVGLIRYVQVNVPAGPHLYGAACQL